MINNIILKIKKLLRHANSAFDLGSHQEFNAFGSKGRQLIIDNKIDFKKDPELRLLFNNYIINNQKFEFMNLSKLGTSELKSKIENGKIPVDQLEAAKELLKKREEAAAKKDNKKETPAKKAGKKKEVKKEKSAAKKKSEKKEPTEKKERKPRTIDDYAVDGVSGLVRKMLMPKDKGSKVAGCSYSEANKAVQQQFKRKLHTSEFDRNFNVLKKLGVVEEKLPPRFKPASEKASEKAAK